MAAPSKPANFAISDITDTTCVLSWDNVANEDGYKIERSLDRENWIQIAVVEADVVSVTIHGLSPLTVYYFRIRAYNGDGNSVYAFVEVEETWIDNFDDAVIGDDWIPNQTDANRTIVEADDVLTIEIDEGHSGAWSSAGGGGFNRSPKCYMALASITNPPYEIITKITDFTTRDDGGNMGGLLIGVSPHLCYGKFRSGNTEPSVGETLSHALGNLGILRGWEVVGGSWAGNDAYGYLWFESVLPTRWKNNTWIDGSITGNDFLIAETDVSHDANYFFSITDFGIGRDLILRKDSAVFDKDGDDTIPVWLKIKVDVDWNITFWYSIDGVNYTQYEHAAAPFSINANTLFGWGGSNLKVGLFAKNDEAGMGATSVSFEYFEIIGLMEVPITTQSRGYVGGEGFGKSDLPLVRLIHKNRWRD